MLVSRCHWLDQPRPRLRLYSLALASRSDRCGRPGILRVLRCVRDSFFELWTLRNSQRHGKDMQSQASEIRRQTIQHLTELYKFRHSVLPEHRVLFRSSLKVSFENHKLIYLPGLLTIWIVFVPVRKQR